MDFDQMTVIAPGWLELRLSGPERPAGLRVLVRTGEDSGRTVVRTVIITGGTLDSQALKTIPIARVEAALNHPRFGIPSLTLDGLTEAERRDFAEQGLLLFDEFAQIDEALEHYLAQPAEPAVGGRSSENGERSARAPLSRPDGQDPDAFYRRVADAYNELILATSKPAPALAEEAGVPVPTVHRWIAEARRRGFLPPARKGRAG